MKRLLIIPFIYLFNCAIAQPKGTNIYEFKNKQLVQIITSIDTTIIRGNNNIGVKLFRIENPFGSAHLPETDEISIKYLASVGYSDDTPNNRLFNLGDYIDPKLLEFKELNKDSFIVIIEHGVYAHRRKSKFLIKLNGVTLVN